jgi:hypothetical protein
MKKRPLPVTLLSLLIAAAGAVGFAYHLNELNWHHPFQNDVLLVELVRLIAIVSGVYMLRGSNWARWLALGWIGFHVVVSAFHSLPQFAFHGVLFAVFAYSLFRRQATEYFCPESRLESSV